MLPHLPPIIHKVLIDNACFKFLRISFPFYGTRYSLAIKTKTSKIYYNANIPYGETPLYNGNISATSWTYNNTINCYNFNYDGLKRLSNCSVIADNRNSKYEEAFDYDKHGNITGLFRTNQTGWTIDLLAMAYDGNQLKKISDEYGSLNKYNVKEYNDLANLGTEFLYDANGNMIANYDREITSIRYNLLNLPDTIQFSNGNQIIIRYAADGSRLRTDYFTLVTPVVVPLGNVCEWNYEVDIGEYLIKNTIQQGKIAPSLTISEKNNLICSLFERQVLVYRDCETGTLLIVK